MDATERFKNVIENQLQKMAQQDELFALSFNKQNKNIDDCIKYILNTVKKSGVCGFTDDEIFGMAAHYYDEDDIDIGGNVKCDIVMNHTVQLTDEEKQKAKEKAFELEIDKHRSKLQKKKAKNISKPISATEQTLF